MECFRLLAGEGVQQGKCDTDERRYLLDVRGKSPRVLGLGADGTVLFQINLERVTSEARVGDSKR